MNIINLCEEQKSNNKQIYKSSIMKEYFNLCRFLHNDDIDDKKIEDIIRKKVENLTIGDEKQINKVISYIEYELDFVIEKLKINFPGVDIAGVVFLIGEGNIDGHGILLSGKAYVVLDILTLANSIEHYNIEVFLLHEFVHSIHYYLNPDMYFTNYIGLKDIYFKRIAAEGIATYISGELSSDKEESNYWLGFFDSERTEYWKKRCDVKLSFFSEGLKNILMQDKFDENIYYNLFSVTDPNKLEDSRYAYYYGAKICLNVKRNRSYKELLKTSENEWNKTITKYFDLVSTIHYINYQRYGVT